MISATFGNLSGAPKAVLNKFTNVFMVELLPILFQTVKQLLLTLT